MEYEFYPTVVGAFLCLNKAEQRSSQAVRVPAAQLPGNNSAIYPLVQFPAPPLSIIFFFWIVIIITMRKNVDYNYIQIRRELKIMPTWFCFLLSILQLSAKRKNMLVASNSYRFRGKETESFKINSVPLI